MDTDLRITGFTDAVFAVLELQETFRRGHAAVALSGEDVLDLTVFAGENHTVDTALGWAQCLLVDEPGMDRVLLLSVGTKVVDEIRESDLNVLRRAQAIFAEHGVDVIDWIQSDGQSIRSLAITAGWDSWGGRAPASPGGPASA